MTPTKEEFNFFLLCMREARNIGRDAASYASLLLVIAN